MQVRVLSWGPKFESEYIMKMIDHPLEYKDGIRIVLYVTRNKDRSEFGNTAKRYLTKNADEFDRVLDMLKEKSVQDSRIYASVEPRSMEKAVREFKRRLLENDYSACPNDFYLHVKSRFMTCLMQHNGVDKGDRLWLFDCDDPHEYETTVSELFKHDIPIHYKYKTKNGMHVVIKPTNVSDSGWLTRMKQTNAMMLWGY